MREGVSLCFGGLKPTVTVTGSRRDQASPVVQAGVGRQDFVKTLAEACGKTGFEIYACVATTCVMALESWMKMAMPGEGLDMAKRPQTTDYRLRHNGPAFAWATARQATVRGRKMADGKWQRSAETTDYGLLTTRSRTGRKMADGRWQRPEAMKY
jgi:hypothetical protein